MSFNDISCHVWAIDGYVDDGTANTVNDRYNAQARLNGAVGNNPQARQQALLQLVNAARHSALTTNAIIVYGGFRRGQAAPEHMWMEYNGTIYETMPGYDLYSEPATRNSRANPQLENDPFGAGVVSIPTFMTANQRSYLISQGIHVP